MTRSAAVASAILAVVLVPVLFVAVRCRPDGSRTQEACLKEAIFCVQRATRQVAQAEDYDACLKAADMLKTEAGRLRELRTEFVAMPELSRWERSRLRKHRPLADAAVEAWAEVEKDFRTRINEGLPPHVRLELTAVLDDFAAARSEAWDVMAAYWD
jgi:hypothetical protein